MSMGWRSSTVAAGAAGTLAALLAAAPAAAEPAVALAPGNTLVKFDTSSPQNTSTVAITGLVGSASLRGIHVRPATGQLYGLSVVSGSAANSVITTYRINPDTGAATVVGATAAALAGAGDVRSGYAFNPQAANGSPPGDRIRYVNTNDENARLNPDTGALAGNDTDLTPASTALIALAFAPNINGVPRSTAYAIDQSSSTLSVLGGGLGIPSANTGVVTSIASLGIALDSAADGGFDVSPTGAAYAALTATGDSTRLYTVDLNAPAAGPAVSAVGPIGDGTTGIYSLAILTPKPTTPSDTTAPAALIDPPAKPKLKQALKGKLTVGFSCNEQCSASATLRAGKTELATASAALAAAGVGELRLAPTKAGKKKLRKARRKGRLKTRLGATFADPAGNAAQLSRKLTLTG
jgi:hypothetical protein